MDTNSTCPSIQVPSLADSYGALFIGTCVSLVLVVHPLIITVFFLTSDIFLHKNSLYGLIIHQTYRYFRLYPGDPFHLKVLVCLFTSSGPFLNS